MQTKKRSPIAAIVLAVVIGLLVIALLNGVIRPTQVVVAKVAIAPGTVLTDQLVELRTIPMGAKPADATSKIEDVTGKILAVGRAPGDLIVTSVLGEIASAGIPAELPEGHVALAIHVDLASGVAGLLRPGQTVTVIGMISPDILKASTTSVFTAPIAEFTSPIVSLTPGVTATPTPTPTPTPTSLPEATPSAYFEPTALAVGRSTDIRLKVEWPRAIKAFLKNPLLGTGYSSITLATDNDYLRMLGETGILGTLAFLAIILEITRIVWQFLKDKNVSKEDSTGFFRNEKEKRKGNW